MRIKAPLYALQALLCTVVICIGMSFLFLSLLRLYTERVTYPAYLETVETGPGSVGTSPLEDTPRPASLSEIRQYDRFAPVVLHYKAMERIGGRQYYMLTLPSGETVIGHMVNGTDITPAGTTESGEPLYQLPISRWVPVEIPSGEAGFTEGRYDDDAHYVECVGDTLLSIGDIMQQNRLYQFFNRGVGIIYLAVYVLFAIHFRRRAIAKQAQQARS